MFGRIHSITEAVVVDAVIAKSNSTERRSKKLCKQQSPKGLMWRVHIYVLFSPETLFARYARRWILVMNPSPRMSAYTKAFPGINAKKYTGYCIIACAPRWLRRKDLNQRPSGYLLRFAQKPACGARNLCAS